MEVVRVAELQSEEHYYHLNRERTPVDKITYKAYKSVGMFSSLTENGRLDLLVGLPNGNSLHIGLRPYH